MDSICGNKREIMGYICLILLVLIWHDWQINKHRQALLVLCENEAARLLRESRRPWWKFWGRA